MSWHHPLDRCPRRRHRPEPPKMRHLALPPRIAPVVGVLWILAAAAGAAPARAGLAPGEPPSTTDDSAPAQFSPGGPLPTPGDSAHGAAAAAASWRTLSIWGGDVRSMAVAPGDPDLVLAGTSTGQLYISHSAGASRTHARPPFPLPRCVVPSPPPD